MDPPASQKKPHASVRGRHALAQVERRIGGEHRDEYRQSHKPVVVATGQHYIWVGHEMFSLQFADQTMARPVSRCLTLACFANVPFGVGFRKLAALLAAPNQNDAVADGHSQCPLMSQNEAPCLVLRLQGEHFQVAGIVFP